MEYPAIQCRSIDIELPGAGGDALDQLVDRLLRDASYQQAAGPVAYRSGQRWEQIYQQVRLEQPSAPGLISRDGGVYLITGGTGGIGLVFARYLARSAGVTLVLIGRSDLPSRETWGDWLANHPEKDRTSGIIREVRAIEQLGAQVELMRADVSESGQMEKVVSNIRHRFGGIHGVIHSAGSPERGMIQMRTAAQAYGVLDPKVKGTLILERALEGEKLDFFILCSSLNAMYAGPGTADYCGANAFLDAFAHSRATRDRSSVTSINWDMWQEVGMAVNTTVPARMQESKEARLRDAILPEEGVDALSRIVSAGLPQVVVSTLYPHFLRLAGTPARPSVQPASALEEEKPASSDLHSRPEMAGPFVAPSSELEIAIASAWQEALGISPIGIDDDFFELGGDSMIAVQLMFRLSASLDGMLTTAMLFQAPTVARLAELVGKTKRKQAQAASNLSEVLAMVEGLSEEEVKIILAAGETSPEKPPA